MKQQSAGQEQTPTYGPQTKHAKNLTIDPAGLSQEKAQHLIRELQKDLQAKEQTLHKHNSELVLLNRVTQVFNSTRELDQILITVMEEVRRLLEVDAGSIWLRDRKTDELVCEYAIGPYSQTVRGWRLAPGQGIAGAVAQSGESIIVPDVVADERHFKGVDQRTGQTLRSILCVALKVKQGIIGVLQVLDTEPNRFSDEDRILQELLATAAAIAIENARLREKLWRAAETKSLLVNEINQRGKNNLEVISELLSFSMQNRIPQSSAKTLRTLQSQVNSLKTVNTMLAELEWNPFQISELSNRVIHASLQELEPETKIFVAVPASPIKLSSEYANNMALMIDELVTNTVKHAMTGRKKGHISVHITRMEHTIHVEFRDDGPGFPEDVLQSAPGQSGLGLLYKIIHEKLRGELTLYNDNGAVTMMRFPSKNGS